MKDFSKYLKDGRRVAAFGQQIGNEVELFLLYCSKKDQFNKKVAKEIYYYYLFYYTDEEVNLPKNIIPFKTYLGVFNPVILRVPIKEGDSAEYTFKMYMNENFYRKKISYQRATKVREFLHNEKNKEVIFLKERIINKL